MEKDADGPDALAQLPGLAGIMKATLANAGIKNWIANRPDTPF